MFPRTIVQRPAPITPIAPSTNPAGGLTLNRGDFEPLRMPESRIAPEPVITEPKDVGSAGPSAQSPQTLPVVVDSQPSTCELPTVATSPTSSGPASLSLESSGITFDIHVPVLRTCEFTLVTLKPSNGHISLDLDHLPFEARLVLFTSVDGSGNACGEGQYGPEACKRMVRRLPVTVSEDRAAYVVKVHPDPSSSHYMLAFQVGALVLGACAGRS
jgi:hypothetical protein